jgi:hypothetical protein
MGEVILSQYRILGIFATRMPHEMFRIDLLSKDAKEQSYANALLRNRRGRFILAQRLRSGFS